MAGWAARCVVVGGHRSDKCWVASFFHLGARRANEHGHIVGAPLDHPWCLEARGCRNHNRNWTHIDLHGSRYGNSPGLNRNHLCTGSCHYGGS